MFCFIFRTNEVLWNLQNKEPRDWQNLFAFTRFRFIDVLSMHISNYYWVKKIIPYAEDFVI